MRPPAPAQDEEPASRLPSRAVNESAARERFAAARVGHLATVGPNGPHVVPVVFAVEEGLIVTGVDHKPKTTRALKRLDNIGFDPRVSVLADGYEDSWADLWWVRADGEASVRQNLPEGLLRALVAKYAQYRAAAPAGPFIVVEVSRWNWWES